MEHIRELPNITKGANYFPAIFFYVNNSNNKSVNTKRPRRARVALGFPGSGLGEPQKVAGFNRLVKISYVHLLITELPTAIII